MSSGPLEILVVDDNPILSSVLSEIFRECGHVVRTASDGFEALAELRLKLPNVLVSDINMPNMSGYELLSVVRRRFACVAVVAMSGAYLGLEVPPGVAADAFYAKGSSGVARLVDIVNRLRDKRALELARAQAPIWISPHSLPRTEPTRVYGACPGCLRPVSHSVFEANGPSDCKSCPHYYLPLELPFAESSSVMDLTLLAHPAGP